METLSSARKIERKWGARRKLENASQLLQPNPPPDLPASKLLALTFRKAILSRIFIRQAVTLHRTNELFSTFP